MPLLSQALTQLEGEVPSCTTRRSDFLGGRQQRTWEINCVRYKADSVCCFNTIDNISQCLVVQAC